MKTYIVCKLYISTGKPLKTATQQPPLQDEQKLIAIRHPVQVLPLDETGHVYRNEVISASKPAIFKATQNYSSASTDRMIATT